MKLSMASAPSVILAVTAMTRASAGQPAPAQWNPAAEWARANPAIMQEYQRQYTRPDGVVNWSLYDDTFRACADKGIRKLAGPKLVVTMCSLEANGAQAKAEQAQARARVQAAQDAERAHARKVAQEDGQRRRQAIAERQPEAIKSWMGAVLGYRAALAEDRRARAKTEIAKEKKYSRIGGVLNKSAIYEAQRELRAADETIERAEAKAKENGVKVSKPDDPKISRVQECIEANHDPQTSSTVTVQDVDEAVRNARSFEVDGNDCLWILLLLRDIEARAEQ